MMTTDLCSIPLQDAFDAVGYFHLALAAALEDQANPEALYVVYMKLAEIHGSHMPDAHLCQVYIDRAQSLKKVLAGVESSADRDPNLKRENSMNVNTEYRVSLLERHNFESERFVDNQEARAHMGHKDSHEILADMNLEEDLGQKDPSHFLADTDSRCVDVSGSETDTIGSQSYSDSVITGSFDTARENISDSSSTTDTYQNPAEEKDSELDSDHSMPSQIPANPTSDLSEHTDVRDTDSDVQDEQNTPTKETDAHTVPTQRDSDAGQKDTVTMNNDKAVRKDNTWRL